MAKYNCTLTSALYLGKGFLPKRQKKNAAKMSEMSEILPLQQDIYLRWGDEGVDTKTHTAQEVTAPVGKNQTL